MSDFGVYLLLFAGLSFCYISIGFFSKLSQILEHETVASLIARIMPRYVTMRQYDDPDPIEYRPDTSAAEPGRVPLVPAGTELVRRVEMSDIIKQRGMMHHDLVALLAILEDEKSKPLFSANEIAGFVGGKRSEVLEIIRAVRKEQSKPVASTRYPALPSWHGQPRTQMHAMDMRDEE